ncbi:hypothetical protein [Kitasatospora indigofera]|uniref:hypothetical protein n=1 Tax=Kitasatospora indigofera TaxID=67307 RepID=UPI0036BFA0D7
MSALTVEVHYVTDPQGLHCWYPGELYPQPAYVELGLKDGILLASYEANIGSAAPSEVRNGIDRQWAIPVLTADAANALLDELAPLAQRVLDGSDVEWDGRNHVGQIVTDEAQEAYDAITERCQELTEDGDNGDLDVLPVHDVHSIGDLWSAKEAGVTAATTDEELDLIEARLLADYREGFGEPGAVIRGLDTYLRDLRQNLIYDQS